MTILLVLIPITLLLVIAGGFAFFWAVNHDQFDDMDSPSLQPLTDSDSAADAPRQVATEHAGRVIGDGAGEGVSPAPDSRYRGAAR